MNSKWTDNDIEILKKYYGKINYKEISNRYLSKFNPHAIQSKAQRLGISKDNSFDFYSKAEDEILKKYYGTMKNSEINKKYLPNRPIASIYKRSKKLGLTSNPSLWEDHEDETLRILKENRMRHKLIAKILGRSEASIEGRITKLGLADRNFARDKNQINLIKEKIERVVNENNIIYNYKQVLGSATEHFITSKLLQNNLFVFKPCVDGGRFDLIATRDFIKYYKIQVKTASYNEEFNVFYSQTTKQINSSKTSGNTYKNYNKDEIDFYICCIPYWENATYVIPVEELIQNSRVNYYPHRKKTFNKFTDLHSEIFRDAFHLIK